MRVLLSHSIQEQADIQALRRALEDRNVSAVEDVLEVRLGDELGQHRDAIRASDAFVLLLSPNSIGADDLLKRIELVLQAKEERPEFRLLVLLRDMAPNVLRILFGTAQPLCFPIPAQGFWVEDAAQQILQALGLAPTDGLSRPAPAPAPAMAELVVAFFTPRIELKDGKRYAAGSLRLEYVPVEGRGIDGIVTDFISPLGPEEAEDLRWYIEDYCGWPWDLFRDRAKGIEAKLPIWGKMLYDAIAAGKNQRVLSAFIDAREGRIDKRITVSVDDRETSPEGRYAAALLFGLPWELLHDGHSYLFDGEMKVRVRRTLPSDVERPAVKPRDRVRVLLVRARPEDEGAAFIDPRSSALPLAQTLRDLGEQVQLDLLPDGTFEALRSALSDAEDAGKPYQVVHFDGHGVYDKVRGLGLLCFEDAEDVANGHDKRRVDKVDATEIGGLLRDRRVPLFVLDACQTAVAQANVESSVAAELLRKGVVSVVAMRYSVLVETAKRFVEAFYGALAKGHRIGRAMVDAQHALKDRPMRLDFGAQGRFELSDWMVPVLFQEGDDPQIFAAGIDTRPSADEDRKQVDAVRRGELPAEARHGFVGRARELLRIERRLLRDRSVAIVGPGGEGKTALATEAARWFLLTQQRDRVAFVSVERLSDARAVLDVLGRQLILGFSVAMADAAGINKGLVDVKSALMQKRTLLVVDNFESLLVLAGKDPINAEAVREIVDLVHELGQVGQTWLITTSREALPAPLHQHVLPLGSLDRREARDLLVRVLREKGIEPLEQPGRTPQELENVLTSLIEAVRGHARSLMLLGPTIAGRGIEATREAITREMVELEKRHPGDRENSLLASVRLSLDRLDAATRKKIAPLCVFRQTAHVGVMTHVLEIEQDEGVDVCRLLVALGLADANGPFLLPDPALGAVLTLEMDPAARAVAETRWREGMQAFTSFLNQQQFQDVRIAFQGTTIALLDLLEALEAMAHEAQAGTVSVAGAMNFGTKLESLVSLIGQPRALDRVRKVREDLTKLLPAWSHARFNAESQQIDRLLEAGNMRAALEMAMKMRDRADSEGDAYPEAAYDRAMAWFKLGRVLQMAGANEQALLVLEDARKRFAALAVAGNTSAARMESACITEQGDALCALGQLDAAAAKYEESIARAEQRSDARSVGLNRGQIGTVRLLQRRFAEALEAFQRACEQFEALGEPASVAKAWHQIGVVHQHTSNFAAAEQAYKESLRRNVSLGNRAGEAATLGQLGSLYDEQEGRFKDAVALYRQALVLYTTLGDAGRVSQMENNLGITLHEMGRLDEAREALKAAIASKNQLGHAAKPWNAYSVLAQVEYDTGNTQAAAEARAQAMKTYRAYRDAGGEAMEEQTRLVVDVGKLLRDHGAEAARALLKRVYASGPPDDPPVWVALLRALDAVVKGSRDPKLAEDPELEPLSAVELQILLEQLSKTK